MSEQNDPQIPSRREFCACCGDRPPLWRSAAQPLRRQPDVSFDSGTPLASVSASVSGRTISVSLASGALATVGGLATTQTSLGNFLLARTGDATVTALTATCTHEGCTVTGFSGNQFVCPCHGSTFNASGTVVNGPANRSLQQFPTQVANGVVTFTV